MLSANPPSVTLASGTSAASTTISLAPFNGFASIAGLSCTPAIPGITCFNASASPGAPGTLSLSFPGLAAGTYVMNVLGQSGSTSASVPFTIVILAAPSGGFGGGGTGGLGGGTGSPAAAPPTGVQSVVFRTGSGWARTYGFVELTDFRFELRLHGLDTQSTSPGTIFQTDSSQVGGLAISSLGSGVRLQVLGLADDNPSAPSCTLDLTGQQAADVVIRYQRSGVQLSLRAYDYTGTVELANSTGNCALKFGTVGGITALSLGADPYGSRSGTFNLAWLRLFRTPSAAAPGAVGVFNPALDFEFEGNLLNTPANLGPSLIWQTGDQAEFGATPSYITAGSFVPVANSSFDLSATAVVVSASTPTATSTISIVPRAGLSYALQADVTCVSPPAGITCGIAYPSLQSAAPLSIGIAPTVQPGNYTITLLGRAVNAQGSGALSITILPANGGGNSLAGNFGSRSLVISRQTGWAAGEDRTSPLNLSDFRLEMRLHYLEAMDGTIIRALSASGEPLGTLVVGRDGDRLEIRAVDLPGDFGGSYNCSIQLTTGQAGDFVMRFQRAGRNYSLRTWDRTGLRENEAPASAPFCLLAQSTSAQFSGVSVGGVGNAASFQIAWLRLYGLATAAAPGGLPAPGVLAAYEFENSLMSNTGSTLDWNGIPPQFVATPP